MTELKQSRALVIIAILSLEGFAFAPQQLPPASGSQQQTQAPVTPQPKPVYESPAVLKVRTRLVVVDVVATGRTGEPVVDLKMEDFNLAEDGNEQKIRVFSFQHPRQAAKSQSSFVKLPPNVFSNAPNYNSTSALNVILLDGLNTKLANQVYARQEMLKFLQQLPPNEPVAVYALGTKLWLFTGFHHRPDCSNRVGVKLRHRLGYFATGPQTYASLDQRPTRFGLTARTGYRSKTLVLRLCSL